MSKWHTGLRNALGACMLWLLAATAAAADFPAPPNADVSSVTQSTTALGMSLSIRRFESRQTVVDVVEYYRRHWQDEAVVTEAPPWTMVGIRIGDHFYNVQAQRGGPGVWGYLSVSDLPKRVEQGNHEVADGKGFPAMSGSRIINDQRHEDPMKDARTILLTNDFSVAANGLFYLNHYRGQGWAVQSDYATQKSKSRAITMAKGRKNLVLSINRIDNQTSVVANIETAGLLGGN